jgi:hypothetical protein
MQLRFMALAIGLTILSIRLPMRAESTEGQDPVGHTKLESDSLGIGLHFVLHAMQARCLIGIRAKLTLKLRSGRLISAPA